MLTWQEIIQRFHIKYYNQIVKTTKPLENRFNIFEEFCYPSVINQRNAEFLWFVLFDFWKTEKYKNRMQKYIDEFSGFKPIFIEEGSPSFLKRVLNEHIKSCLEEADRYIITTRVDNDDSIHQDMMAEVQKIFDDQDDIFINFDYGFQYDVSSQVLIKV